MIGDKYAADESAEIRAAYDWGHVVWDGLKGLDELLTHEAASLINYWVRERVALIEKKYAALRHDPMATWLPK